MLFIGLNNKRIKLDIRPSEYPILNYEQAISLNQYKLGQYLLNKYPNQIILEEFSIPTDCFTPRKHMRLDFFIPSRKEAYEMHGEQHFSYSKFMHGNKEGFSKAQSNDKLKLEWCSINNIQLIIIDETMLNKLIGP